MFLYTCKVKGVYISMSNNIGYYQYREQQNPKNSGSAIWAGLLVQGAVAPCLSQIVGKPVLKNMHNISDSFSTAEKNQIRNAIYDMLEKTKLKEKGVSVVEIPKSARNPQNFTEKLMSKTNPIWQIMEGNNAGFFNKDVKGFRIFINNKEYLIKKNSVCLPEGKLLPCGFHELGHAMNYNFSKFGKALQKFRPVAMALASAIGLYSIFTTSTPKQGNKDLTTGEKTKNFIRENAGKLSFLAFTPILIEEGMATIKGQKWANKLLDKNLAKQVFKGNKIAYLSYLGTAIATGVATWAGVKIKDHLNKKSA